MPVSDDQQYTLPEAARNNARRVLEWREQYGDEVRGMTSVGWRRARQIADNETVSGAIVRRMSAFNRHRQNAEVAPQYTDTPWRDAGNVAWLGWGGTTGIDWARRLTGALELTVTKRADELRMAYGWLSVATTADGEPVVDRHGHVIDPNDLERAAIDFMLYGGESDEMHVRDRDDSGRPLARVVESMMFTADKAEALGIPAGSVPIGWWVGIKVFDDDLWDRVCDGTYSMLSIGASAIEEDYDPGSRI